MIWALAVLNGRLYSWNLVDMKNIKAIKSVVGISRIFHLEHWQWSGNRCDLGSRRLFRSLVWLLESVNQGSSCAWPLKVATPVGPQQPWFISSCSTSGWDKYRPIEPSREMVLAIQALRQSRKNHFPARFVLCGQKRLPSYDDGCASFISVKSCCKNIRVHSDLQGLKTTQLSCICWVAALNQLLCPCEQLPNAFMTRPTYHRAEWHRNKFFIFA